MPLITLNTPLENVPGIQRRFLPKLKRLGILTVKNLLWHLPTRYEDWSTISDISDLKPGDEKTIHGIIQNVRQVRAWKRRMIVTEAIVGDKTGSIHAVWFNQPYIGKMLQEGKLINLAGKINLRKNELYFPNPAFELVPKSGETRHTAKIIPIYRETRGITSRGIRFIVFPMIKSLETIPEFIPEKILDSLGLREINIAIRDIHMPERIEDAQLAKRRFAFQDLFLLHLKNEQEKLSLKKQKAPSIKWAPEQIKDFLNNLPFGLTHSQKKSLHEILKDIEVPHPMNRLLQGDVGSGKTIIAGICAIIASHKPNNMQSVFMAPTEILARQHYKTLQRFFENSDCGIGLLLSKESRIFYGKDLEQKITKPKLLSGVETGKIGIVVGTHALIQKNVRFKNLAFVVVDEQHRFGVKQRAELTHGKDLFPHFLSMSATPIPRTLTMTVFGNLNLSLITELPVGRKPIITKIVAPENRDKAYAFIRGEVRKGRQVYVVCPRIEPSEENAESNKKSSWDDVKAVKKEYEKLEKTVFPDLRIAMLHGKLKSAEKDSIMKDFIEHKTDVLITTTVIEVGVDVPNTTIMMIEGADRFGLAQLYQLRGRVGRSEKQSFCFLFTESNSYTTKRRLESLLQAKNGFELAEKDLEIRGPGEFLGESQSGMPDIAMKAIQNPELLKSAQEKAIKLLEEDKELKNYPALKEKLAEFDRDLHLE
jgi:ATP-dependent DNA helicase RecG